MTIMFNIKRKIQSIGNKVKKAIEPPVDPQVLIAEIHESFDTASEKLLQDAKKILSGDWDIDKGERLKNVGFVNSKKAVEAKAILKKREESEKLAKQIEYYQIHYPNNKFITEEMVKTICQKYGLLCGETEYYIGDVPEKNLQEIEGFKLREDDCNKINHGWWEIIRREDFRSYAAPSLPNEANAVYGYVVAQRGWRGFNEYIEQVFDNSPYHFTKKPLKICASVKDFDTKNMRIENGYKLEQNLPDPIVLQPVKGGYLIVSKWGLEASDEIVVNQINN